MRQGKQAEGWLVRIISMGFGAEGAVPSVPSSGVMRAGVLECRSPIEEVVWGVGSGLVGLVKDSPLPYLGIGWSWEERSLQGQRGRQHIKDTENRDTEKANA